MLASRAPLHSPPEVAGLSSLSVVGLLPFSLLFCGITSQTNHLPPNPCLGINFCKTSKTGPLRLPVPGSESQGAVGSVRGSAFLLEMALGSFLMKLCMCVYVICEGAYVLCLHVCASEYVYVCTLPVYMCELFACCTHLFTCVGLCYRCV